MDTNNFNPQDLTPQDISYICADIEGRLIPFLMFLVEQGGITIDDIKAEIEAVQDNRTVDISLLVDTAGLSSADDIEFEQEALNQAAALWGTCWG